jgi:Fe-S-cluster-containing hydrogenase component 2
MKENIVFIDNERCDFCGTCVGVCPEDAIELRESTILIDKERCILCGDCVDICPLGVPEVLR